MSTQPATLTPAALAAEYEMIDSTTLAERWCLPESWVREHVRSRTSDPIPHVRFGKYVRFRWASPELNRWLERHSCGSRKVIQLPPRPNHLPPLPGVKR